MNRKALLSLTAILVLAPPISARAQQQPATPPAPAAPPVAFSSTFYADGDNFLGVHVEEVTRENMGSYGLSGGEPRGVGVRSVVKGSPAERAGLREKDVIVRFDGEAVTSVRKLTRLIDESSPEHTARLTVLRGGSEQQVSATLGKPEGFVQALGRNNLLQGFDGEAARRLEEQFRSDSGQTRRRAEELGRSAEQLRKQYEELQRNNPGGYAFGFGAGRRIGITTSALGPQLAEYFGVRKGVLVNTVEENSPAAKSGLRAGDVIVEAEGEQIDESGDLTRALNRKESGEVTLSVYRDRKQRTLKVTPERRQPQSFNLGPGQVYAIPPVAAIAPRAARAPRVITAPAAPLAPRIPRVTPPAARAFRGGAGRVL
jgi:serine protease Do